MKIRYLLLGIGLVIIGLLTLLYGFTFDASEMGTANLVMWSIGITVITISTMVSGIFCIIFQMFQPLVSMVELKRRKEELNSSKA